jgi:hypothetical protein
VVEYLKIPRYDATDEAHRSVAALGLVITRRTGRGGDGPTDVENARLEELTLRILGVPPA